MSITLPATFVERIHELSPGALKAYLALAWIKAERMPYPTQLDIANHMNASYRSVVTYLKELEDAGYITKQRIGAGRKTDYVLVSHYTYGDR
jgi:DNA-binding MarR family transcriptional regulator